LESGVCRIPPAKGEPGAHQFQRAIDETAKTMQDQLIRVDKNDNELGFIDKAEAHDGRGILHRAFSIVIWNSAGKMLIQKRSPHKRLWANHWANACCSHPRKGERLEEASHRRLKEELGFDTELEEIFSFVYQATFEDKGSEYEYDHVLMGSYDGEVMPDPDEIAEYKWIQAEELQKDIEENPGVYAPWFRKIMKMMQEKGML
jgi:isopentenyl-diphosphate delta-isomerase